MTVRTALTEHFPNAAWVFDNSIAGGCSARRPDAYLDMGEFSIIVECDENQHRGPSYSCESLRTMTLFRDAGNRPLVVVRLNPDSYRDSVGILHPGCFTPTPTTLKLDVDAWNRRVGALVAALHTHMNNPPTREVTEELLFYDDYEL